MGLLFTLFIKLKFFISLQVSLSIKRQFTLEIVSINKVSLLKNINEKSKYSLISSNDLLKFSVPKTSKLFFIII